MSENSSIMNGMTQQQVEWCKERLNKESECWATHREKIKSLKKKLSDAEQEIKRLKSNGKQVADAFWIERTKYDEVVEKFQIAE